MAALPGTGALQCSGHDQLLAGLEESERVILSGLLVEVSRKEPTGFVWQEWINANGFLAQKVIFDDRVSQWEESSCLSVDSLPLFRTASVDRFPIFHGCRRVPRPFAIPLPALAYTSSRPRNRLRKSTILCLARSCLSRGRIVSTCLVGGGGSGASRGIGML
jgi:hypothetical protein